MASWHHGSESTHPTSPAEKYPAHCSLDFFNRDGQMGERAEGMREMGGGGGGGHGKGTHYDFATGPQHPWARAHDACYPRNHRWGYQPLAWTHCGQHWAKLQAPPNPIKSLCKSPDGLHFIFNIGTTAHFSPSCQISGNISISLGSAAISPQKATYKNTDGQHQCLAEGEKATWTVLAIVGVFIA